MPEQTNTAASEQASQGAEQTTEQVENTQVEGANDTGSEMQPESSSTESTDDANAEDYRAKWEEAQKHIKKLNEESAKHRNAAKTAKEAQDELKQQVLQAFGAEQAESPEDALKAAQEQAAQAHAELQRYKENDKLNALVKKANGNPDIVIPFLRGSGNLPDFGADDYDSQVEQIIADTLENQPGLRAQVAPKSSGQPSTPTGGEARLTRADLRSMSAEEILAARRAGKLDHLIKN